MKVIKEPAFHGGYC